jgi:hypothetical protein
MRSASTLGPNTLVRFTALSAEGAVVYLLDTDRRLFAHGFSADRAAALRASPERVDTGIRPAFAGMTAVLAVA